jgi:hypothetical protein
MPNRPITIQSINPDGSLNLSDNGNTVASPGDTITWIIGNNSGVASITGIVDNSNIDVFNPDPAPVGNSSNWQGTIRSDITQQVSEDYTINYTTDSSTEEQRYDPRIQVNP